jgi:hypothetical protein
LANQFWQNCTIGFLGLKPPSYLNSFNSVTYLTQIAFPFAFTAVLQKFRPFFEVNFRPRTLRAKLGKYEAKLTFEAVPNPLPGTPSKLQKPR